MGFTLTTDIRFSLAAAAAFAGGFPGTEVRVDGDAMSFAWPVDGDWHTARVELRQVGAHVHGEIAGSPTRQFTLRVRRDVERILCLDVDGGAFTRLARHDPVVARLQQQFPGLRPVLFFTPYEAAAWAVIARHTGMTRAAGIRRHLATALGQDGAFPAPDRLALLAAPGPGPGSGLTDETVGQLRALAGAARDGALGRDHLRQLPFDVASEHLQQLPGIDAFAAELVLVRGVGAPDALPHPGQRLEHAIREAYGLPEGADTTTVVERWRPYRSWVGLLLRAAAFPQLPPR